jgi:NAD(P)-dependent dehydrogenase (short-subunit alcohol dehydrogenase family)
MKDNKMTQQSLHIQDLFSVAGKVVLVTGGSRGIGLMIARGFVANGAKVYISSRKAEVCQAVAAELSKNGRCVAIPADLATAAGRAAVVATLQENESSLDVLVNNAGAAWGAPFDSYPESGYDKVMEINVKSIFMLTQALLPLLEANASTTNPARVINIGSIDGIHVPSTENYAYSASKAAVHHLTKVLAVKLGRRGITVNAIAPGPFASKMTAWMLENFQADIEAQCPLERIGQPSDMAGIALYLASAAAAYINGVVIPVDGGLHLV